VGVVRTARNFLGTLSGTGTDLNLAGTLIHTVHPNKSPILEKRERGRSQRITQIFWVYPISETGKGIRTSNFVRTLIGSIGGKPINKKAVLS